MDTQHTTAQDDAPTTPHPVQLKPTSAKSRQAKPPRLKRLKEKQAVIEARIRKIEATEKARARKQETRKKIVVGGFILDWMERDSAFKRKLLFELEKTLKRNVDRALFDFETRSN